MSILRIEDLTQYINDLDHHREKECQPYLARIPDFLCRETPRQILVQGREEASRYGYNDYCVSAIISDGSVVRRVAYVWEVKAPQCFILEFDDHDKRLRPTRDLIKAETQLFHHVEEFRESKSFREYFQLDVLGQVVPAGIIIGCDRTLVRNPASAHQPDELKRLFTISMYARNTHLYSRASIVVKTWEWVRDSFNVGMVRLPPP